MIRLFSSPWMSALVGGVLYLLTTAVLLGPGQFEGVRPAATNARPLPDDDPSWKFRNPELDQWLAEAKREKEELALGQQQLKELQARLAIERQEISSVTQTVYQLQIEFDKNVLRFQEQEMENFKRQAKVMASMSPEGAAALLNEMPEEDVVRLLFIMKTDEVSSILDTLSKAGQAEAKRAAALTEKLRRTLPAQSAAKPRAQ